MNDENLVDVANLYAENQQLRKERDKASKDFLELYSKIENVKNLVRELIKKEKHKIETNDYVFMFIEELGDLKNILDMLEKKDN